MYNKRRTSRRGKKQTKPQEEERPVIKERRPLKLKPEPEKNSAETANTAAPALEPAEVKSESIPNKVAHESPKNMGHENIALFIDIENFVNIASTLGLPIDVPRIVNRLSEIGTIRVRKAYGDLMKVFQSIRSKGWLKEYNALRSELYNNLVDLEDVPYINQHKNTSDTKLIVEALAMAYSNPHIRYFALIGSDRDYVPLYQKLHEMGRQVIVIAIDKLRTNIILEKTSDYIFYYDELFGEDEDETLDETPPVHEGKDVPRASDDSNKKEERYRQLFKSLLKIDLPSREERLEIIEKIQATVEKSLSQMNSAADTGQDYQEKAITLNTITDDMLVTVQKPREVVYKIVLGLFYARCFYVARLGDNHRGGRTAPNYMKITGVAKKPESWEAELYRNYIMQIQRDANDERLDSSVLARILYESADEDKVDLIESLQEG